MKLQSQQRDVYSLNLNTKEEGKATQLPTSPFDFLRNFKW